LIKEFANARSLSEAAQLLKKPGSRVLAGGTTFFEFYERGLLSDVETIIDIGEAGLNYVVEDSQNYRVGAGTTLEDLRRNRFFDAPQYQALKEAVQKVEPIQIRNVATIGGSLCSALPQYDPPIALWALNASVVIVGSDHERVVSANEFTRGFVSPDLEAGELVKEILIPKYGMRVGSSYEKLGRTRFDYGIVTVASLLEIDGGGSVKKASVVLGNYHEEKPFRAIEVEKRMIGHEVSSRTISEAVGALDGTSPPSTIHASSEFKKELAKTLVARSLSSSHQRAVRTQ
jgi:CO/xanthine dehydrogenase FAD-binding subunit